MIPHHQVAIDMSELLIPRTINPDMLHSCRNIIRKQRHEVWEMGVMKSKLSGIHLNLEGPLLLVGDLGVGFLEALLALTKLVSPADVFVGALL